jgi:non-ribosomal peptide synthetase component F
VIQVASGTTLRLGLEYDTRRFDADTASRLLGHLRTLLEAMPAGPDRLLGELPILTAEERTWLRQFAVPRGGTAIPSQCLHHRFEAQVARTPDAVALVYEGQTLTYRQLDLRAGGLARQLRQRGVGPDILVGLCVERSLDLVVGILAILKAGGAYVPLDPGYPAERLAFMLEDSGVRLLLTQARLVAGLPSHRADVLCIDTPSLEHETAGNGPALTTDNIANIIYT